MDLKGDLTGPQPRPRELPSSAATESDVKRRKIRKGTRSCWECKRRKIKCTFASPTDEMCSGCQRRGANCISQEHEEPAEVNGRGHQMDDRIVRVEALVEQLAKKVGTGMGSLQGALTEGARTDQSSSPTPGIPTPEYSGSESARCWTIREPSTDGLGSGMLEDAQQNLSSTTFTPSQPELLLSPPDTGKYAKVSEALYATLPSQEEVCAIYSAGGMASVLFQRMLTKSYGELDQGELPLADKLAVLPSRNSHPTIIAKRLFIYAIALQFLHPEQQKQLNSRGIFQDPRASMKRLAETAIKLVNANDELVGSMEGIECLMLEVVYHHNSGNLRQAWLAVRRAMVFAQLMGIHRGTKNPVKVVDPSTRIDPQFVWFRILYADRFLCLMLGLPQGSPDQSLATEHFLSTDTPLGRLERVHCVIYSKILERNERDPLSTDFAVTQAIDMELQKAARSMPSQWWLIPSLPSLSDSLEIFNATLQIVGQAFHYNLVNQLHLPYMLLRNSEGSKHDYSKMICVNASREVLSRFIAFRSFNQVAFCCRAIDFVALVAAMTLLLAHLDSHRYQNNNFLAHQRSSDRAMMVQVLESMEKLSISNMDVLSRKSSEVLRKLLDIEAGAADGRTDYHEATLNLAEAEGEDGSNILRLCIPYFGTIKIARGGLVAKEAPQLHASINRPPPSAAYDSSSSSIGPEPVQQQIQSNNPAVHAGHGYGGGELSGLTPQFTGDLASSSAPNQFAPSFPSLIGEALNGNLSYPGLTAGSEDWAFQGVDMAFFDSLTRGADSHGSWGSWMMP